MDEKWAKQLWDAQRQETYVLQGQAYDRLRFGSKKDRTPRGVTVCHDCGARLGQFHVPSCDMERCPACGGQMITCGCRQE
jgi:hypothetical protein